MGSSPRIENCVIYCCEAAQAGGGAMIEDFGAHPVFYNCRFSSNRCRRGNGGAAAVSDLAEPRFERCVFYCNTAEEDGGALYADDHSTIELLNCTFYYNTASRGGAAFTWESGIECVNCIFSGNEPQQLFCYSQSGSGRYCLLDGNRQANFGHFNLDENSLWESPQFISVGEGNFGLSPSSPCINAGDPQSPPDPDESRADIGAIAFEMSPHPALVLLQDTLFFPRASLDERIGRELEIRNYGRQTLIIRVPEIQGVFQARLNETEIASGASLLLPVGFEPQREQTYTATLRILTNDPSRREAVVGLMGRGFAAPELRVSLDTCRIEMGDRRRNEAVVSIFNCGEGDLIWRAELEGDNQPENGGGNPGPRPEQHEPGEIIQVYEISCAEVNAMAWDGRSVWIAGDGSLYSINPADGRETFERALVPPPTDLEFLDGCLWTVSLEDTGYFRILDFIHHEHLRVRAPVDSMVGIAGFGMGQMLILTAGQELLLLSTEDFSIIERYGILNPVERADYACRFLTWTPGQYGGQFWTMSCRDVRSDCYLC